MSTSNLAKGEAAVRAAQRAGAQIILLPELFETPYFCIEQDVRHLELARTLGCEPRGRASGALLRASSAWCCR